MFGTIHPGIFRLRAPIGSQPPIDSVRLAKLGPGVESDAAADEQDTLDASAPSWRNASFEERFGDFDDRPTSFNERFASLDDRPASFDQRFGWDTRELTGSVKLPPQDARPAGAPPMPTASKSPVRPRPARRDDVAIPEDGRTAIYDITARAVYLPNGRKLEAHSGLGGFMDNPRHVHLRMRGATPPNVYNLTLRERPFHGVRAIRLNPVDGGRMYGRAGILAHTYMLGPNGQSNGCVSFSDYPEFLNAYLRGEVARLAVVERLDNPPGPKLASGWLPDAVKNFFKASDNSGQYAAAGAR